jgi:hypothetical protein
MDQFVRNDPKSILTSFHTVGSVPLGEDTMNSFQPPTSNHSSPIDTSAALQVQDSDLPLIRSSSVGLLIRVMDVVYSGASRMK